jgi:hypothetical protein
MTHKNRRRGVSIPARRPLPSALICNGSRMAPVRLVVRDDATAAEILQALEAGRANLDKLLDSLPDRGGVQWLRSLIAKR